MTATPAQVANDLDAQAAFFNRRLPEVASACRDCARLIRTMLRDEKVDGRTYGGVQVRLLNAISQTGVQPQTQIAKSLERGLRTMQHMRAMDRAASP